MTKLLFYERIGLPDSERLENELGTTHKGTAKSEECVNWIRVQRDLRGCITEWSGRENGSICGVRNCGSAGRPTEPRNGTLIVCLEIKRKPRFIGEVGV